MQITIAKLVIFYRPSNTIPQNRHLIHPNSTQKPTSHKQSRKLTNNPVPYAAAQRQPPKKYPLDQRQRAHNAIILVKTAAAGCVHVTIGWILKNSLFYSLSR